MNDDKTHWYAVHTKPRWEKKVAANLDDAGIKYYCPLNKVMRQWSDRKKVIQDPLFKGYVFVQIADEDKVQVLQVHGVVNFVHWLGKPAKIQHSEIDTIRHFLNEFDNVEVAEMGMQVNNTVRVKQGLLMNYKGILIELKGSKATVHINSMGLVLSAVFDKKNLEIV